MKTEELRIGNLVNYKWFEMSYFKDNNKKRTIVHREAVTILGIDAQNNRVLIKANQIRKNLTWISLDKIKPIGLTEEYLLNIGFIWSDPFGCFVNKGYMIEKIGDLLCDRRYGVVIKYVHQLQNLYFMVKGNELIIK